MIFFSRCMSRSSRHSIYALLCTIRELLSRVNSFQRILHVPHYVRHRHTQSLKINLFIMLPRRQCTSQHTPSLRCVFIYIIECTLPHEYNSWSIFNVLSGLKSNKCETWTKKSCAEYGDIAERRFSSALSDAKALEHSGCGSEHQTRTTLLDVELMTWYFK